MSKSNFLDMLKSSGSESKSSTWDVLKDDYMLGAKLKDWKKDEEEEEGEENEEEEEVEEDEDEEENEEE